MNKSALLCLASASLCAGSAWAMHDERVVIVNGQQMNSAQIAWLDQRHCAPVPNGRYWLDLRTGACLDTQGKEPASLHVWPAAVCDGDVLVRWEAQA